VQVGGCGLGRQQRGLQQELEQFEEQLEEQQRDDDEQRGAEAMLQSVLSPQQTPFPKPPMMQLMPLQMSLSPLSQRDDEQQLGRQLELQPGISNIETSPS